MTIPNSARIVCANCLQPYDYRENADRSCPECSCPPPTIRSHTDYGNGAGRGEIVPNPAHAEFLARKTGPVNTGPSVRQEAKPMSNTESNKPAFDKAAYQREYMRRKRAEKRGGA